MTAPTWGYPSEGAYHRDASSSDAVVAVKIPYLSINAEDDPVSTTMNPSPLNLSTDLARFPTKRVFPMKSSNRTHILYSVLPIGAVT